MYHIKQSTQNPLIGIPCDVTRFGLNPFHGVGEKYINAVAHGAGVFPMLIPAQGPGEDLKAFERDLLIDNLLNKLDGIFFSGSPSNIEPHHYGDSESLTPDSHDPQRDHLTIPLIKAAIEKKMPVFAICRGMQELNVALGGSLHQKVQELPGMMDHREDKYANRQDQYKDAHDMHLTPGGLLSRLVDMETVRVNSLHGQGVNQLGDGLVVEARAPDGLVEAVRLDNDEQFLVAVQWHPEWQYDKNPLSSALFKAFGEAVVNFHQSRGE